MPITTHPIEVARALAPVLEERGAETEAARRMLPETLADLRDSGLFGLLQPRAFGGMEEPFDVLVDVIGELAYADASTAWVCANMLANSWQLSMFDRRAQEDVWGGDPGAILSCTLAPTGKIEPVEGGYHLSGRWEWGSGCDVADWGLFGGIAPHPATGDQPTRLILLAPRSDWTINDTWFVSGLRGTGSKDIEMAGAFIPTHRAHPFSLLNDGKGPGRDAPDAGPLTRLPMLVSWASAVAATPVGAARRLVDDFAENSRMKLGAGAKASAGQVGPQLRLAESSVEVDTARLILRTDTRRLMELAAEDRLPSLEERSALRRNQTWAVSIAVRAVDRVFGAIGTAALQESSATGRRFRDVHAAQGHHALVWDSPAESYARVRLGLEPNAKIL